MLTHRLAALAASLALSLDAPAQIWTEIGEAGDLPTNGQVTIGSGPLTQIDGNINDPSEPLGAGNDRDIYRIRIDDPMLFLATTVGGTTLDTQLFLFDRNGFGVAFNDDTGVTTQSAVTGTFVPGPGDYWLAISRFDRDATSGGAEIWADTPFSTERAPDGAGAAGSIDGWNGIGATVITGAYSIFLRGCSFPRSNEINGCAPGSVLLFPIHRSGPNWFTILMVTNTALTPVGPNTLGGTTSVHFEYVNVVPNPANPFLPLSCSIFDRIEALTPADTVAVLTTCHNAWAPGGQEGYVVVSAEDPTQPPGYAWDHDWLIGNELVLSASGIAYMIKAIAFEALTRRPAIAPAELKFDGVDYSPVGDALYVPSFIALAQSSLCLVNLTGGPHARNTVDISVWNDNERALSVRFPFSCWFDQPLTRISTLFSQSFLAGTTNDPEELDINCDGRGELETGWARIDSVRVEHPSGQWISDDGAIVGCIAAGVATGIDGGELLWDNGVAQHNGAFRTP